jgi:saccharopine dehydrogenase-like NADP-dependent oxidoreductase
MAKVMIIGAGGVGRVVAHKCAQVKEVFHDVVLPAGPGPNATRLPLRCPGRS